MKLKRRRKFSNRKKKIIYFSLFFLLLFITVGYAYLSRTLSITGSTTLAGNTWDIHFANLFLTSGSVNATTPAAIHSDTTSINYSVVLDKPGDFYEFEVDIINGGTLGAKVTLANIQGISAAAEPYLESSIKYTNGNPVQVNDLLNAGSSKRVVVRVAYIEDLNSLPEDPIILDLTFTIVYTQTNEVEINAGNLLRSLTGDNSCIYKYTGSVTDSVGVTTPIATNVYFDRCADKRNVIFGGFCWQIIRTTETGGLKMIYNGEPVNDKCESSRGNHKGIVGAEGTTVSLNANYLYGDSFTYDENNNTFTLTNSTSATWSDSTYENLLGKFTCKNTTGICTTLYNVNLYNDNTSAYIASYTIGDTNYAQIGTSPFNAFKYSPAMAGYMFNKVYSRNSKSVGTNTYKYGNTFTYDTGTNTYTLSGTTQDISDWNTKYNTISNTHYTCWNDTGICTTISYIYHSNEGGAYYFNITGGKGVNDILNEMLYNDDVNTYNSNIKGVIDAWYAKNLSEKTNILEDTIFCNARNTSGLGGWNPNGGNPSSDFSLKFKIYNSETDLFCQNETDQFAVGNNKAKLTYPVGLLQDEERNNIRIISLMVTNSSWLEISPYIFYVNDARVRDFVSGGTYYPRSVSDSIGVRPVISLDSTNIIFSGSGSEADPWVVE